MEESLAFRSITPHLSNLRYLGIYQIDSKSSRPFKILHKIQMGWAAFLIVIYSIQQLIKVYQVRRDPDKVIDIMFLLLTYTDAIYKQLIMWTKQDQIEELLQVLKGPFFNQNEPYHRDILLKRARQARILLRAFNITALFTCALWVLYPTILYLNGNPVEFPIWLPFEPNTSLQFCGGFFYVWIQTSFLAYGNTTMDAFISLFFAQSKTQLSIIRLELINIVAKSREEAKITSSQFSRIFNRRFRNIIFQYDEVVALCKNTQKIFGGVILYLFLISAWIICTSAYRMINIKPFSVEFSSMILYMTCILTEIFLYCYFGNEVTHESQKLMESAFAMDWLNIPIKYRYSLIVFIERIKRPIVPLAGVIIPLSNTTFVSILRSSYTFYAFLKNTE